MLQMYLWGGDYNFVDYLKFVFVVILFIDCFVYCLGQIVYVKGIVYEQYFDFVYVIVGQEYMLIFLDVNG